MADSVRKWQVFDFFSAAGIRLAWYSLDGELSVPSVEISIRRAEGGFRVHTRTWDGEVWKPCGLDEELKAEQRRLMAELKHDQIIDTTQEFARKQLNLIACLCKTIWGTSRGFALLCAADEDEGLQIFAGKLVGACDDLVHCMRELGLNTNVFEEIDINIGASQSPDN